MEGRALAGTPGSPPLCERTRARGQDGNAAVRSNPRRPIRAPVRRASGAPCGRAPAGSRSEEGPCRECRHNMPTSQPQARLAYLDRPMPMTATQLRAALKRLGLSQVAAAARLGVAPRTMRYWVAGERRIPGPGAILLRAS